MNHTNEEVDKVCAELEQDLEWMSESDFEAIAKWHLTKLSEVVADSALKTAAFNEGAKFSMELVASLQSENQRMRDVLKDVCFHNFCDCEDLESCSICRANESLK